MLNQDKYKTPEERNHAFSEWCFNMDCESCKLKAHNFDGGDGCRFYWLALEAEEEKPEPCPFCGGETHINLGHLKDGVVHYWVDCISPECMYRSAHYTDRDAAISAHNRVARAVMASKEETKMSNKQETIADIVADIRAQNQGLPEDGYALSPLVCDLLNFADRIEAEAKREREAGAEAAQVCGEIGEAVGREATREKSSRVGNAAKMREALSRILGIADHLQTRFTITKLVSEEISELKQIAESALSSPPRNCDLFATSKEAGEAFISQACENPCGNCTVSDEFHNPLVHECGIEWLFAEAKGVTDGSK